LLTALINATGVPKIKARKGGFYSQIRELMFYNEIIKKRSVSF